ncbi:unnamed protein product [Protopolystoma xenopodis]|uniref:Uncharacterized protein n=1 Tax=Protopolystoma xenopodis TaxID=117903 RepID=A0A3S5CF59_9PLAT|nr:unnamed protein product [Protopolystoma xenopodis]
MHLPLKEPICVQTGIFFFFFFFFFFIFFFTLCESATNPWPACPKPRVLGSCCLARHNNSLFRMDTDQSVVPWRLPPASVYASREMPKLPAFYLPCLPAFLVLLPVKDPTPIQQAGMHCLQSAEAPGRGQDRSSSHRSAESATLSLRNALSDCWGQVRLKVPRSSRSLTTSRPSNCRFGPTYAQFSVSPWHALHLSSEFFGGCG